MAQIDRINGLVASIAVKAPCRVATTANITLAGYQTIDGITLADGDANLRVLVKNQTDTTQNGIYDASSGTWSRSPDFDGARDIVTGTIVSVNSGTSGAETAWRVATAGTITIGTSVITFEHAVFSGSDSVAYLPSGIGAVATTVQARLREIEISATGYDTYQEACDEIVSGSTLRFPAGNHTLTNYLTITGKSNFAVIMDGVAIPSGTLNNLATGLFRLVNCSNFKIQPNVVNAAYASTLNIFSLDACTNWEIAGGKMDVKYNSLDGSAAVNVGDNCTNWQVHNNYIRAGYGVLVNDRDGVEDGKVYLNDFVGQVAYGNTGPGDAVEINTPTYGASSIRVFNNNFSGYKYALSGRAIIVGFANVDGVTAYGNEMNDCVGMIGIHAEDNCSNVDIYSNPIKSAHIGVNIACNTTRGLKNVKVHDNPIELPALDVDATYAAGAGIKIATNQTAGNGEIIGLSVVDNDVSAATAGTANNGIIITDHQHGVIAQNKVRNFAGTGLSVFASNSGSAGIKHSVVLDNISSGNTTENFSFARGAPGNAVGDVNIFSDVLVEGNRTGDDAPTLDYYSGLPQAYPVYSVSQQTLTGNAVSLTDNTATKIFTITVPNASVIGQVQVDYNAYNTETANRIQESGSYVFTIGRQAGSALKIAASSKFGNSQVARLGAGAPTVTLTAAAVVGAVGATNTIDIQFTYNLGAVSENNCEFEATYVGNLNTVTLAP